VLVAEDDSTIRYEVEKALWGAGYAVRVQPRGSRSDLFTENFVPDLAIIDVSGPETSFDDVLAHLGLRPDLPSILLNSNDSPDHRLNSFRAGADDYLIKPIATDELVARVRALIRRARLTPDSVRRFGNLTIDHLGRMVMRDEERVELTCVEHKLLWAFCQSPGRLLSKQQLVEAVWGRYQFDDDNVVEVHVCNIRRKLEAHGPRLIHTVRCCGYVFRP